MRWRLGLACACSAMAPFAAATNDPTNVVAPLLGDGPQPGETVLWACHASGGEACEGVVTWPAGATRVAFRVSSCDGGALESCSGFTGELAVTLTNDAYGDRQAWSCYFEAGVQDQCALASSSNAQNTIHNGFTARVEGLPDPILAAQAGPLGAWHFWEVSSA